jgi:hypothetical protein
MFYSGAWRTMIHEKNLKQKYRDTVPLKVPKREIFVTELFILSDTTWVCDLRTEPKKPFV